LKHHCRLSGEPFFLRFTEHTFDTRKIEEAFCSAANYTGKVRGKLFWQMAAQPAGRLQYALHFFQDHSENKGNPSP
jgi:hypothetical protein